MKHTLSGVVLLLVVSCIFGCGDTEQEAILTPGSGASEMFGAVKQPTDLAPAAPSMPGTPRVTAVGFYKDWQLTEAVDSTTLGTTVFVKVTFSEPMRHVVSDGKQARPVLYYQVAGEQKRFTMAPHGAKGKDFVSGVAKPLGKGTTRFIGKLNVTNDTTISIGKWSVDVQGNPLAKSYTHPEVLEVTAHEDTYHGSDAYEQKFVNGRAVAALLPSSAWVLDFPGPYREHQPPASHPTDFVGQVCMHTVGDAGDAWAKADWIAPVSGVTVTITDGPRRGEQVRTDTGGYYLFPRVSGNELYLRVEKEFLEPREVIVSRSRTTKPQQMRPNEVFNTTLRNRVSKENDPGVILMGLRWPDAIRYIIENEMLPHNLLCVTGIESPRTRAGSYGGGRLSLINDLENRNSLPYDVLLHEIGHARQHANAIVHNADSIMGHRWKDTPEGKAYAKAWEKDLKEHPSPAGPIPWIDTKGSYFASRLNENAAEFCSLFWDLELELGASSLAHHPIVLDNIRERSPHRFKWAEQYLNAHP